MQTLVCFQGDTHPPTPSKFEQPAKYHMRASKIHLNITWPSKRQQSAQMYSFELIIKYPAIVNFLIRIYAMLNNQV